jgi:hypothetical protein
MKNTLIQKIPCYRHESVIKVINDDNLTTRQKAQAIYDYAFDYERKVTNHRPAYVLSAGAIEQILLAIDSID